MPNKRMIHASFFDSELIFEWTIRQRLLMIGIITFADDQGRIRAHERWLKSKIFPYDDIPFKEIKTDIESIASSNDTIILYEVEGIRYIQLKNWWDYQNLQWAKPSDYPPPENWIDRIRMMIYVPARWVMSLNWPGVEDNTTYKPMVLPNKLPNKAGNGLADASALINTTTTTTINTDSIITEEEALNMEGAELSAAFVNATQIPELTGGPQRWFDALKKMGDAGVTPEDVECAVDELRDKNYNIVSLSSVVNASISVMSKRLSGTTRASPRNTTLDAIEQVEAEMERERRLESDWS